MDGPEKRFKHLTLGGAGVAAAVCILPLILGSAAFGLASTILAPLELAAIGAASAGVLGLAWVKLRGRSPTPERDAEEPGEPARSPTRPAEASTPPACDFDAIAPGDREDHAENAEALLLGTAEVRETANGYAFRLSADPDILGRAARFIAYERQCCPFFRFALTVEPGEEAAWLELGGGPRVKEYLRTDLVARIEEARTPPG